MPSELLAKLAAEENFWAAWEHVRAKRAAAGLDGVSVERLAANPEPALDLLRAELLSGRYHPWPLRRVWLPKPRGGRRAIGVGAVRDRIAQRALLQVLAPRCEPRFNPSSFAYRPGIGVRQAVAAIEHWRDEGYTHVLETDIEACFDTLDRRLLHAELLKVAQEPDVLRLVGRWLTAGVVDRGTLSVLHRGVAQGDILSPLLCNLYLDPLDDALDRGSGRLVRYADDLVILTRTEHGAQRARERTEELLRGLHLDLNQEKTRVTTFERGFEFLGVEFIRGLAVPLHQEVVVGPDGLAHVCGRPAYELELPPPSPGQREPAVLRRLGHALDHAAARADRHGRRLTSVAEAFREALAEPDDEPASPGAELL